MSGLPGVRDSVSFRSRVRKAGGVCTRTNCAGIQTAFFFAAGAEFCVPVAAAPAMADRIFCDSAADLSELGLANSGAQERGASWDGAGGARGLAAKRG